MIVPVFADFFSSLLSVMLLVMAIFIILLVLVQRGRGGGLAGALGGAGGSSAFGAKAGDVFTKITAIAATIWIVLCIVAAWYKGGASDDLIDTSGYTNQTSASADAEPGLSAAGDDAADEASADAPAEPSDGAAAGSDSAPAGDDAASD